MARRAMVRHDARVIAQRPHTKTYSDQARERLALAVIRGRTALGHRYRPSFAKAAKISPRSLLNIETGTPVGPLVYEAVARALPNWTEDTPRIILEGGPIPPTAVEQPPAPPPPDELDPQDEMERKIVTSSLSKREKRDLVRGYRAALEEERMLKTSERHPHGANESKHL